MFVAQTFRDTALPDGTADTLSYNAPGLDPVSYNIICIPAMGADGKITDWSLRQLEEKSFSTRLGQRLAGLNVHTAYAPTVSYMSGAILPTDNFKRRFDCGTGVSIYRPDVNPYDTKELVSCDGTRLEHRKAFVMSAAGCPAIVLSGRTEAGDKMCFIAHAGRNSLIDKALFMNVKKRKKSRVYFSVVDALVASARKAGADPKKLTLRSFFAIPWQSFPHPLDHNEFGKFNQAVHDYFLETYNQSVFKNREDDMLCLSLPDIIRLQAQAHGIGTIQAGIHTLPENGYFAKTTHELPELRDSVRNLVVCTWY